MISQANPTLQYVYLSTVVAILAVVLVAFMRRFGQQAARENAMGAHQNPDQYPDHLHQHVSEMAKAHFQKLEPPPAVQGEFRTSLKSVRYRFKTCVEAGTAFADSIRRHGDAPPEPQRYFQEREFFSFVMAGMASLEALHYALFAWGAAVHPDAFPILTEKDRRGVTPPATATRFGQFASAGPLLSALEGLRQAEEYQTLSKWRTVLFHRGLPGRRFSVSVGGGGSAEAVGRYHDFGDLQGPELDPTLPVKYSAWLVASLESVLTAAIEVMPTLVEEE